MKRILFSILLAMSTIATAEAQGASEAGFEYHGVVEGFYGNPWEHEERLEMLRFMGEVGFNTFFYAPKDDPYHRTRWREPYPDEAIGRFRELLETARNGNVTLFYAISPGLSIEYSSDEDFSALETKIDAMMEQGVRHFALFVDDVPEELAHEADREMFANLAEAHVYLINRLHNLLQDREAELIVCPTTYTDAWGDREYVRILGEGVPQDVAIFWTGTDVAVERITADQAREWGELLQRRPLIWDNFPVNDYDAWRPFLGPLRGRDTRLASTTRGIIANPMVEPYLSMIPLYTVADFARDPAGYNPDASLMQALVDLYGADAAEIIEPVVHLYSDFGWEDNLFRSLYAPGEAIRVGEIESALRLIDVTVSALREERFADNVWLQGAVNELEEFRRKTAERVDELEQTGRYHARSDHGDRVLIYDETLDRYVANRAHNPQPGDGRLCDWSGYAFHPLHGDSKARASFQYDDDYFYVAVEVDDADLRPGSEHAIYEGDHVVLALSYNGDDSVRYMTPGDVLLQVGAPGERNEGPAMLSTVQFTEHSARGAMDLQRPRLSHFFQFFAVEPEAEHQTRFREIRYAVDRSEDGYFVEAAFPREDRSEVSLEIGHFDVDETNDGRTSTSSTLSRRGYLFNPAAYAMVELR